MDASMVCACCNKTIFAEAGRLAAWCRYCGADLKPAGETPRFGSPEPPSLPAVVAAAVTDRPAPVPDAGPTRRSLRQGAPYFHAYEPSFSSGSHDLYRFYLTETDLLVFQLGVGSISLGQIVPRTRSSGMPAGGVAGAFAMMREAEQLRLAGRIRELDAADEWTLRDYAAEGDAAFIAGPDDLRGEVRIDPPSFWNRLLFSAEHEGVLKFRHRKAGSMSLALPSTGDVRRAAEGLTRLFGEAVRINLPWAARAGRPGDVG